MHRGSYAVGDIKAIHNRRLMHYTWYVPDHGHYEPTEDDWTRRTKKRKEAVQSIKRTIQYQQIAIHARPLTPDPMARTSKRTWEAAIQKWREELREIPRDLRTYGV